MKAAEEHFHVLMLPRRMAQVQRKFLLSVSIDTLWFWPEKEKKNLSDEEEEGIRVGG